MFLDHEAEFPQSSSIPGASDPLVSATSPFSREKAAMRCDWQTGSIMLLIITRWWSRPRWLKRCQRLGENYFKASGSAGLGKMGLPSQALAGTSNTRVLLQGL